MPVRAEIVERGGFSVHAHGPELALWVGRMPEPQGVVYVVHGEPAASEALAGRLAERGVASVVARDGERVRR